MTAIDDKNMRNRDYEKPYGKCEAEGCKEQARFHIIDHTADISGDFCREHAIRAIGESESSTLGSQA